MSAQRETKAAASAAMLTAAAMIAHQVGGKATRDALYLSHFNVTSLPYIFIASALFSLGMVVLFSRLLTRFGPARVLPAAFGTSALLLFGEGALLAHYPRVTAVAFYLHMAGLGGVLISGFWSVVNERFDPRAAKRLIGRIAGGATFGGLLGGLLAERVAESLSIGAMLPILGVLHIFCAWRIVGVDLNVTAETAATEETGGTRQAAPGLGLSVWDTLRRAPYLRNLAVLVLLAGISNLSLDYVFKAHAVAAYGNGEALLRFFAIFYTLVALGTFFVQTALSRWFLERLGLSRTVGALPLSVAVGGTAAALISGLPSAALARGAGSITSDSLFRSGYEILYTPIPPAEKRSTKAFIDVGCDRIADLLGGGIIRGILQAGPALSLPLVLGVAIILSVIALWFTQRLNQGYVVSLERGLLDRAVELDLSNVQDSTTRSTILRTAELQRPSSPAATAAPASNAAVKSAPPAGSRNADPTVRRLAALRSGDLSKVREVLREPEPLDAALVPSVIALLAWDDIVADVIHVLREASPRIPGQLIDTLLDADQPFAIHRRIPRILMSCPSQRVANGLLEALAHKRFEVRYQCGCALEAITQKEPAITANPDIVFEAVRREAMAGKKVWQSHQLLDQSDDAEISPFVDDVLRDRTNRTMEHVFRLLSLVLPKDPLRIAFRGLHAGDSKLRGIALEYLESVLPPAVREPLWPFVEDTRTQQRESRSNEEILATLVRSHESIELDLAALRQKSRSNT
jgi:ATP/ADP translocase